MEKLLDLLEEYCEECNMVGRWHYNGKYLSYEDYYQNESELILISKRYGFIGWLVRNDKIERIKVFHFIDNDSTEEDLICLLALDDFALEMSPTEFLISILK